MMTILRAAVSLVLALTLAVGAAAQTMRAPQKGEPALAVDLPQGWKLTQADQDNAYAMSPSSTTVLQLSMIHGDDLARYTLARVAEIILKEAGSKPYSSTRPGMVVGRSGEVFFSEMSNDKGVHMSFITEIARLDTTHAAAIITLIVDDASGGDRAELAALKARVRLIGARQSAR